MTQPVRLQLFRRKGSNLQAHSLATNGLPAVNVARASIWGNPFVIGKPSGCEFGDGGDPTPLIAALTRAQVIEIHADMMEGALRPEMHPWGHRWRERLSATFRGTSPAEAARSYLRGRNLACTCGLDEPCHADTLLEIANR
jgi:hypothetical protein